MNFSEAMDKLKEGKKVSRSAWNSGYFLMVNGVIKAFKNELTYYTYTPDIMVSEEWIVDEQDGAFKFCEVVPLLMLGHKASFSDWENSYIIYNKQEKCLVRHSMEETIFTPDFDSFLAGDWIEL